MLRWARKTHDSHHGQREVGGRGPGMTLEHYSESSMLTKQWLTFMVFSYPIAITLTKFSILALIARIFTLKLRYTRWGVWLNVAYTVLWCLTYYLPPVLLCRPFSRIWTLDHPCSARRVPSIVIGGASMLGDIAIVLLPQPLIWRLHMKARRRFMIALLLAAGILYVYRGDTLLLS